MTYYEVFLDSFKFLSVLVVPFHTSFSNIWVCLFSHSLDGRAHCQTFEILVRWMGKKLYLSQILICIFKIWMNFFQVFKSYFYIFFVDYWFIILAQFSTGFFSLFILNICKFFISLLLWYMLWIFSSSLSFTFWLFYFSCKLFLFLVVKFIHLFFFCSYCYSNSYLSMYIL